MNAVWNRSRSAIWLRCFLSLALLAAAARFAAAQPDDPFADPPSPAAPKAEGTPAAVPITEPPAAEAPKATGVPADDPFADPAPADAKPAAPTDDPFGDEKPAAKPADPPLETTPPADPKPADAAPGPSAADTAPKSLDVESQPPGGNPFADDPGQTDPPAGGITLPGEPTPGIPADPSSRSSPGDASLSRGIELLNAGQLNEAAAAFAEAIKLDPQNAEAYTQMGVILRLASRFDDAIDAFSAAIQLDRQAGRENGEALLRRGIVWHLKGEYGIALDDFDEAAAANSEDPRPDLWRGLTLARQGNPLDAVTAYAVSIRRNRSYLPAYHNRGLAYVALEEYEKAISDFNRVIRDAPKDARMYFHRGIAQAAANRWDEAANSYAQAIRLRPEFAEAYHNRGLVYRRLGETAKADADRNKAHELDPKIESAARRGSRVSG